MGDDLDVAVLVGVYVGCAICDNDLKIMSAICARDKIQILVEPCINCMSEARAGIEVYRQKT